MNSIHSPAPSTPTTPFTPANPEEYSSIIHSIQRRATDRGSSASADDNSLASWNRALHHSDVNVLADLEADLRLSAQVGQQLLAEKGELERKLLSQEAASQKLLDRLTGSVKECSQLQRRLEEAVGNLEQAESNNRALLVALEEDRKKISRLTAESVRLGSTSTQLKTLTRAHDDTKQELASTQKKAAASEVKNKKQAERIADLEGRLKKAIEDLEEMRQVTVLRSRKSHDALAKVKARFQADEDGGGRVFATIRENPEAAELLKLVENLVSENDLLRSESVELHELLDGAREELGGRRVADEHEREAEEREDEYGSTGFSREMSTPTLASEGILSPSVSNTFSDFDNARPHSPASTNPTSFTRSWGPSSNLSTLSSRPRGLDRSTSSRSSSPGRDDGPHTHFQYQAPGGHVAASNSRGSLARRRGSAQSAALSVSTNGGKVPFGRGHSRRAMSMDANTGRNRRHHRADSDELVIVTVDHSTQTSPRAASPIPIPHHSTPRRHIIPRSVSPGASDIATPPRSTSDLSEGERDRAMIEFGLLPGTYDARTAVLGVLVEHAAKLLARIQSADIVTQENRLKKQHLSGDVRHLAQANLRDVVSDIEGLRDHFRRVLERERTTLAKEGGSGTPEGVTESLVVRRDFVTLVKLFRDLLFETTRLRSLLNRVELDPSLAHNLKELDVVNVIEAEPAQKASNGLLAPLSRLLSAAISSEPEPITPKQTLNARPSMRPIVKLSGSSAVSSATVNVEFAGGGAVRRAVAQGVGAEGSPELSTTPVGQPRSSPGPTNLGRKKSESQVRRDLSSIFAGAPAPKASTDPWVVLPTSRPTQLSNPFGRLLAAYKPAPSSTTNAVLDSLPHAPPADVGQPKETLLERQLRPRGLSDSSIRSTFVAHANPHHRLVTPASLALSSEVTPSGAKPIIARANTPEADQSNGSLKQQLEGLSVSVSRRPSHATLRPKASSTTMRSVSSPIPTSSAEEIPSVPALPMSISISPSTGKSFGSAGSTPLPQGTSVPAQSSSVFGTLTTWLSPLASAAASADKEEEERGKGGTRGEATGVEHWASSGERGRRVA
ncbi:hypothetical protein MNV49_004396 [Pseudohyphozyma bogoriensis]|nr:hypothetical protein MNV49_004396 [Pseudohyphozyma bogoriensis]